ncbi:MAG: dCTP deaminase [Usitatibacteraceae bacterium]
MLDDQAISESLASAEADSLFIDPLLDKSQVGKVTIDLRLGYDFRVSIMTRKPSIDIGHDENQPHRMIGSYFQETRRELGDRFVLYPNQIVLSTTLEYVCLPPDVYADILSRSSYTRLGIPIGTMVQPGYRGTIPLELFNHGNSPIELVVGCRICQARLYKLDRPVNYLQGGTKRKYFGQVRPAVSAADADSELEILSKIRAQNK